jgi:hypothetical protein
LLVISSTKKFDARVGGRDAGHPALGVVCPSCGSRVGKPCVSTVPTFGIGSVGSPIEGVHVERVASAREDGLA